MMAESGPESKPALSWRIYYGDDSVFSDRDGSPFDAPSANVQVVVGAAGILHSKDAWVWRPDTGWRPCDTAGLWDYLLNYRGPKAVLFGRTIRDDHFWEIVKRAQRENLQ